MEEVDVSEPIDEKIKQLAVTRAKVRASNARWDLNVAIFLFAVLILILILLFQGVGIEIVAPIAIFGLAMVWLVGWRRGRELYRTFYDEELAKAEQDLEKKEKREKKIEKTVEETIDEKIQKALRERLK